MPRAARTSRSTVVPAATGQATPAVWWLEAVVFGKPPASVTVAVTVPPPATVAASTYCPGKPAGSVTVVLAAPAELVVDVVGLKVAVPTWSKAAVLKSVTAGAAAEGPLDCENVTVNPAGNGVPSGWMNVAVNVNGLPPAAEVGAEPDDPEPTV